MEVVHDVKLFGVVIGRRPGGDHLSLPKPKVVIKRPRLAAPHRQELPREYRELIAAKGVDVEGSLALVLSRSLTKTDMSRHHSRLSMPRGQIKHDFLTPAEEELILQKRCVGKRDRCGGVEVKVVDPSMRERTMTLARWNANKDDDDKKRSWWYALTTGWMALAGENGLAEGDALQVWSFRFKEDGGLGFIMHKVQPPPTMPAAAAAGGGGRRPAEGDHKQRQEEEDMMDVLQASNQGS